MTEIKALSIKEYLDETKRWVEDIMYNLKIFDTWKIYVTIAVNFVSSKDTDEKCLMHSKSNNTNDNEFIEKIQRMITQMKFSKNLLLKRH